MASKTEEYPTTPEENYAYQDIDTRDPEQWKIREEEADASAVLNKYLPKARELGGPGSGNFGHAGRPGEVGGSASGGGEVDYDTFEAKALAGITKTSRTAKGVSDTSTNPTAKQKLAVSEGDTLKAKTEENVRKALKAAWDEKDREFQSPEEVKAFLEQNAQRVSEGLLPAGQGLYRTWETPVNQTPPAEIKNATAIFARQLHEKLVAKEDPVEIAAWAEKRMSVIHPWADGVGRSTKVLSAYLLARGGKTAPSYPDAKTYYAEIKKSPASWSKYYKGMMGGE